MCETVKNYTCEKYIVSYADKLRTLKYPQDKFLLKEVISRLLSWYKHEIDKIVKSNYIVNKNDHTKSISVLIELNEQIKGM